jgi:hypothetical protein
MSGLSLNEIQGSLASYLETCWAAMLGQRYHLLLAKGGPDYPHLAEQPFLTHVLNGVFAVVRLVRFLVEHHVPLVELNATFLRQILALYTLHDLGKLPGVGRLDNTEFSIPLERLAQEYEALRLSKFVALDLHLMRAVNVHKRSARQGDLLETSDPHATLLYTFVRLADTMASAVSPEEAASTLSGWLARLGPEFSPGEKGRFALYWHQIQDVRGVLTHAIHNQIAHQLTSLYAFYPLLYFTTGLLYLAPRLELGQARDRRLLIESLVANILQGLLRSGDGREMAREGLRPRQYDFQKYVYAVADPPVLLELIQDDCLAAKVDAGDLVREDRTTKKRSPGKDFVDGLLMKKKLPPGWNTETVFPRLGVALEEPPAFLEHWARGYRYLLYVDSVAGALISGAAQPENRLAWFLENFPIPRDAADNLRQVSALWAKGGPGKHVIPIAYHFLRGPAFRDRPPEALPADEVLRRLHQHTVTIFAKSDTRTGQKGRMAELGFQPDLTAYLSEQLLLSWAPEAKTDADALPAYARRKRKGHGDQLCSLCNRSSPHTQPLRTGILDDEGRIFSNRVLPAEEAPGKNRPWCPVCHLEFISRKLVGLGLPSGADYGNSRRLYLYILPTFSFTPEHVRLFSGWLKHFHNVSALAVRDYGAEWGIPHRWLLRGELNPDWLEEVQGVLEKQAHRIAGQGGRSYVCERLVAGEIRGQPHYYLIFWEKLAGGREQDDARIATRTEAWAKGVLAATVIAGLSGCKVYVTERPYLLVIDPADLKATVTLDSSPPALRRLAPDGITLYGRERGTRSGLEQVLDMASALWTVTAEVHGPQRPTKDKHISERLTLANTSPLAGATFYKEYARLNNGRSPGESLVRACQMLLDLQGGDLMDLVTRIAEKALGIRLPYREYERGKVHSYELTFREAVDAMRKAYALIPELREMALTGARPSANSVAELKKQAGGTLFKAMERRSDPQKYRNIVNPWRLDLNQTVGQFVDLIVDEAFLGRAGGSFARFQRLENSLADGVYYHTDRVLAEKWDAYNRAKAERKAEAQTSESISFEEVSK